MAYCWKLTLKWSFETNETLVPECLFITQTLPDSTAEGSSSVLGCRQGFVPHLISEIPDRHGGVCQTCWIFFACAARMASVCTGTLTDGVRVNSPSHAFQQLWMSTGSREGAVVSARGECMAAHNQCHGIKCFVSRELNEGKNHHLLKRSWHRKEGTFSVYSENFFF